LILTPTCPFFGHWVNLCCWHSASVSFSGFKKVPFFPQSPS
jgi:hypothetical protein